MSAGHPIPTENHEARLHANGGLSVHKLRRAGHCAIPLSHPENRSAYTAASRKRKNGRAISAGNHTGATAASGKMQVSLTDDDSGRYQRWSRRLRLGRLHRKWVSGNPSRQEPRGTKGQAGTPRVVFRGSAERKSKHGKCRSVATTPPSQYPPATQLRQ